MNALAADEATIENYLLGRDTINTLRALRAVGVESDLDGSTLRLRGRGLSGFDESDDVIFAGTSATTARFMAGLLAADPIVVVLTGARSLRARPMGRAIEPLREMGATILSRAGDRAPLTLRGGALRGIEWTLPVASAEAKTAIALAALRADGRTRITSPIASRDHTERMLAAMGADVDLSGTTTTVGPLTRPLDPLSFRVPGEISVAVYWLVVGSVHPDAELVLKDVCVNPTRTGLIDVLRQMGGKIELVNERVEGVEPVADIHVRSARLVGTTIGPETVPRMIDEFPGFALAASLAEGETVIRGAGELRAKKSDRIGRVASEYRKLGADIRELEDGFIFRGVEQLVGTRCRAHGDHRLATSLATAGLVARGETIVEEAATITDISYPGFWADVERVSA